MTVTAEGAKTEKAEKAKNPKVDLASVVEQLEKKYGKGCVGLASAAKALGSWRRIETGIFAVDHVTGGGIPYGAASMFYGMESGGKSALALKTIAAAQKMCREHVIPMAPTGKKLNRCGGCGHRSLSEFCPNEPCKKRPMEVGGADELQCPECKKHKPTRTLYMDSEGGFTNEWAAKMGCDCDLVHVFQPESAEEAMDGSMMLLETEQFELVVVDTIAQLVPQKELEETAEKWQQGLLARLMNKALRSWVSRMNQSGVDKLKRLTMLLLNQIRYKIGVMFGDPTTRPGGKGQDFAAVLELKMWAGKYEQDDLGNTLGSVVCMNVAKNKTAPTARQEGNFRLWLRDCTVDGDAKRAGDTEEDKVLLDYALKFDVVKYDGKTYVVDGYEAAAKVTSRDQMMEVLKNDKEIRRHIRKSLLGKMLGEVWYDIKELEKSRKKEAK